MRSALRWLGIVAYPSAVFLGFILCASQISICKEHHKKEKQAEAQRYLTTYLSSKGEKDSLAKQETQATNPEPLSQCGDICSIVAKTIEDPVAFFTLLLSIVVWLQLVWMIRQEGYLDKSIGVAEKTANAASRQARYSIASVLPVISFAGEKLVAYKPDNTPFLDPVPHGEPPPYVMRALVCLKNSGKTYANILRFSIRWKVAPQLPQGPPEPIYDHMAVTNILLDHTESTWLVYEPHPIVLSNSELEAIKSRASHLWIYGFVAYGDFMEDIHTLGFCYRWEMLPAIGITPRGLVPDGPPRYRYQRHQRKEEVDT